MAGQHELSTCHKSPTIFITTITFIIGIFTAFELAALKHYIIFGTIKGIISWTASLLPLSFTMYASSLGLKPMGCPSKISTAMCDHLSSCLKNSGVPVTCCSVLHLSFYISQFSVHFRKEHSFFSGVFFFRSSSCLLHSCIIFLVKCWPNYHSAILLPCSFAYFITFNCKPTVYKAITWLLHILRTNLFSIN